MRLKYRLTTEDFVAFNMHHHRHSPSSRRMLWTRLILICGLVVLAFFALSSTTGDWFPLFIAPFACAAAAFVVPITFRAAIKKTVRNMYAEGNNRIVLGPHELELTADALIERSRLRESRLRLEAVERIADYGDYIAIYISAVSALLIPIRSVEEGNVALFLEALKARLQGVPPDTSIQVRAQQSSIQAS